MNQQIDPQPEEKRVTASRHWGVAVGIILALILVYWLRVVLLPFVAAGAVAYVTTPAVGWASRKFHWKRWIAAMVVFFIIIALMGLAAFWVEHVIVPQFISLSHNAPKMLGALFEKIFRSDHIEILGHRFDANALAAAMVNGLGSWIGGPATVIVDLLAGIMMFFLAIFLLAFFLISGPQLARGIFWLVPPSVRPRVWVIAHKMHPILYRYIGGVMIIVIVACILCYIGAGLLLGLPDALVVSLAVGVLEAVPVIGPIISASLLAVIAVGQGNMSLILGVALFALSLRLFIDQLMGPIIIGGAVRLHPAIVIFVFLVGGTLFGVLGVLLAVPTAATIKVALQNYYGDSSANLRTARS